MSKGGTRVVPSAISSKAKVSTVTSEAGDDYWAKTLRPIKVSKLQEQENQQVKTFDENDQP